MQRGEELVVSVEDFAARGRSIAKVGGQVLFVPGVVSGDVIRVRVRRVKRNFAEAEVVEILERSPRRVAPQCSHFGICGGCKWQQAAYEAQLDFKHRQVADLLTRVGGFGNLRVEPTLGSDEVYFYRNKMEFSFGEKWMSKDHFAASKKREKEQVATFALGLHPAGLFSKVLDIDACFLQSPLSNAILTNVRRFARDTGLDFYSTRTHTGYLRNLVIREGKRTGDVMVNVVTSEDRREVMEKLSGSLLSACPAVTTVVNNVTTRKSQVAIGEFERIYHGPGYITEKLGVRLFKVSANSFFQTNTLQAEKLYHLVERMADLRREDIVYDLYSGTGTIALCLADNVRKVIGVESVDAAVLDARQNAELNEVPNCFFEIGDLKEKLTRDRKWIERHGVPDVVILDPPRSGVHEKVVKEILKLGPDRIVYVSCNPATLARDLQLICASRAYEIREVQPVDMFPHTDHIECVVGLKRINH